jgi:hypothetical protein
VWGTKFALLLSRAEINDTRFMEVMAHDLKEEKKNKK